MGYVAHLHLPSLGGGTMSLVSCADAQPPYVLALACARRSCGVVETTLGRTPPGAQPDVSMYLPSPVYQPSICESPKGGPC